MGSRDDILDLGKRIGQSIVGQDTMVERLLLGPLANGHLLVEGLPGSPRRARSRVWRRTSMPSYPACSLRPICCLPISPGRKFTFPQVEGASSSFSKGPVFANLITGRRDQSRAGEGPIRTD